MWQNRLFNLGSWMRSGILFGKERGFGLWKKETWKQFRAYSIQELKDEMKAYKRAKGMH
jgi:DNA-binding transcriptional regulator/RsmH inhibitor MraZ